MRQRERVFIDSGAWIALALTRDPFHTRALELWALLMHSAARLYTSVPVVIETFTFLERNVNRDVALQWKDSFSVLSTLKVLECGLEDLNRSWAFFQRRDLHKLSAVDATSFALMKPHKISLAFTFDHHFASVGFRVLG